jgi:hypothetical protein
MGWLLLLLLKAPLALQQLPALPAWMLALLTGPP